MTPTATAAMTRALGISKEIEEAAWFVLGPGLQGKASPLDGRTRSWSVPAAAELLDRLDRGIADPKAPMMTNLRENLEGATRGAKQLAVELLFLQSLPLAHEVKSLKVKRARVAEAACWLEPPLELPEELYAGMTDHGVIRDRTAEFNWTIWDHLKWLCRFVRNVAQRPAGVVQAAIKDPLQFHRLAASTPDDQPAIRRSIEFLAWPSYFEPVVADVERQEIRDAFASLVGGARGDSDEDITADIHRIRLHLDEQSGQRTDWYSRQLVSQWRKVGDPGRRAWLLRTHSDHAGLITAWHGEEKVTLDVEHLRHLDPGVTAGLVQHAVDEDYKHLGYVEREDTKTAVFAFLTVMKPGDLVLYQHAGSVRLGGVLGEPEYNDDNRRLRRKVRWFDDGHTTTALPRHVQRQLATPGIVVDVTRVVQALQALLPAEAETEPDGDTDGAAVVPPVQEAFRPLTQEFAASLHMELEPLQEIADLLQENRQLVLYGPPGTGKTYLAKHLAAQLADDTTDERVKLVQFHPSYAYEDFFEGYRPDKTDEGQVSFKLVAGPLRRLAEEAAKPGNEKKPYFLIIDEMNRANLAKVFGELYFLLEYRDDRIYLQYSPNEPFTLPDNLYIIGTMNTADRSIAMMDAAIRRRFSFIELHPQTEPVKGSLLRFLQARQLDPTPALLLDALNGAIDEWDRDLMIGPSYFMKPAAQTPAGLRRIWKYELMPLLEEHYHGQLTRAQLEERFGLDQLLGRVAAR
ncbi:5-methylcytosine-specific restriction protein B [Arthrobacter ulcerisalmonis]|uniref:McrB family protein n=1 Tax=Arthrobacter sp. B1I2 TaxID=3042263 RepID=UPI0027896156|nr:MULTISPECIES: AAA family ATPase [Arthrobacter]MDQ0665579.1 5-methylcytosine-specific restriction protein B [Arthrobacter ulcerisalmonis]MDQ0729292.1 5-methylcytosine-specific restriction protein B [Arthrobacter sp. B1I2]